MIMKYLEIGKIVGTHALKGEVRVQPWCDSGDFLKQFKTLYFGKNGESPVSVSSVRPHGNVVIIKFDGIDSPEKAQEIRGKILYMKRADAKLKKGQYFIAELIGCKVIDFFDENKQYGTICDVSQTGANDVWHIKGKDGKEYLIPSIPQVVRQTDVESGLVKISPMRGIFDEEVNGDED